MDHSDEFVSHADVAGHPVGYISQDTIDGDNALVLIDEDGDPVAVSFRGMTPLISFAANHGIEIMRIH